MQVWVIVVIIVAILLNVFVFLLVWYLIVSYKRREKRLERERQLRTCPALREPDPPSAEPVKIGIWSRLFHRNGQCASASRTLVVNASPLQQGEPLPTSPPPYSIYTSTRPSEIAPRGLYERTAQDESSSLSESPETQRQYGTFPGGSLLATVVPSSDWQMHLARDETASANDNVQSISDNDVREVTVKPLLPTYAEVIQHDPPADYESFQRGSSYGTFQDIVESGLSGGRSATPPPPYHECASRNYNV